MTRIDGTYQITLAQLAALADFIALVDEPPLNAPCEAAHQIIQEVLGPDEKLVYLAFPVPEPKPLYSHDDSETRPA